ncbi:hypothetical protein N9089_03430 [Crocinitomicaceae bacterium]|nr:hypothetical protein [Crocinitomicaceae bacterium]
MRLLRIEGMAHDWVGLRGPSPLMDSVGKADIRLCGAAILYRTTAADHVASGERPVCNRNGHPPAGQSPCQDDLKQWPGQWL